MSTAQELDYTTLKWVKNEIDENLKQTRQALETYVENPADSTQLRFCTTYLHQIYGTLQMVEIYGGALLAEEMEKLAHALLEDNVRQKDDAYDVLMRAILQLPSYLEHLEHGEQDRPVILLPLLNDLRAARGEHLLSENAFFSPNLSVSTPISKDIGTKKPINLSNYAKKLRSVFQSSLVGLYRNEDTKANLRKLGAVFKELLMYSTSENAKRLWWISAGITEALFDGGLETNNHIKQLISQIDAEIKRLINDGEKAFDQAPATELIKNLLYYVATSKSTGSLVTEIKKAFNLEQLIPSGDDISLAFERLRGSSQELMESVTSVIKEDLLQLKDQLDIFVRDKDHKAEQLVPFSEKLGRISDTLAMLGLGDLHKIIQDQTDNIRGIIKSGEAPNDTVLMEIASALLYIESTLECIDPADMIRADISKTSDVETDSGNLLPASEKKQLTKMVITEAATVLAKVKEKFNTFAEDTTQWDIIRDAPVLLNQVKGVLAVLSFNRAARLLQVAINYIAIEMIQNKSAPNSAALDELADVITSIEYYLEAVGESRGYPDSVLEVAENSIEKLGYPVDTIDSMESFDIENMLKSVDKEPADSIESLLADDPNITIELNTNVSPLIQSTVELEPSNNVAVEPATVELSAPIASSQHTGQPMDDIDEEILEIFIEEADEILVTMHENLQAWKQNNTDTDALSTLRRSYHTIKGSGRLAGATVVGDFAWSIENMLNRIVEGKLKSSPVIFMLLDRAEEALIELTKQLKGQPVTLPDIDAISQKADSIVHGVGHQETKHKPIDQGDDGATLEPPTRDGKLVDIFKKEAVVHIQSISDFIGSFAENDNKVVSEPLMRAIHTLHGSARVAKASVISSLSEPLDHYVRTLYDCKLPINSETFELLKSSLEFFGPLAEQFDGENEFPAPQNSADLLKQIAQLHAQAKELAGDNQNASAEENRPRSLGEDAELTHIFLEEANEILANLGNLVTDWQQDLDNYQHQEEIQRALHTLKGGAKMAEVVTIADLCTQMENTLEGHLRAKVAPGYELVSLYNQCHSWLISAIDDVSNGKESNPALLIEQLISWDVPVQEATNDTIDFSADLGDMDQTLQLKRAYETVDSVDLGDMDRTLNLKRSDETIELDVSELMLTGDENSPEWGEIDLTVDLEGSDESIELSVSDSMLTDDAYSSELLDKDLIVDSEVSDETIELSVTESLLTDDEYSPEWAEFDLTVDQKGPEETIERVASDSMTADVIHTSNLDDMEDLESDEELTAIFLEEATEILHSTEQILELWLKNPQDYSQIAALQRALHTLKGGARMANITSIATVCHSVESVLEKVVEQQQPVTDQTTQLIQAFHEWAHEAIGQVRKNEKVLLPPTKLLHDIENLLITPASNDLLAERSVEIATEPNNENDQAEKQSTPVEIADFDISGMDFESAAITPAHEETDTAINDDDLYDEDLIDIFLEEADEIQGTTDSILHQWQSDLHNSTHILELQRALHTLKGGARMAGITVIGDVSHAIETLLEAVTEGRMKASAEFPKLILQCHDWLGQAISDVKQKRPISLPNKLLKQLENLHSGRDINADTEQLSDDAAVVSQTLESATTDKHEEAVELIQLPMETTTEFKGAVPLFQTQKVGSDEQIRVRADLVDTLVNHAGEANIFNARIAQQLTGWQFNLAELSQTVDRMNGQLRKFEIEAETQIMYRHSNELGDNENNADFDPLELDRFSVMQQLSRGMVESLGDLISIKGMLDSISGDAEVLLLQQSRVNTDLQQGLTRTRLTPFSSVLARLRRVVRQTCQETHKEANLNVIGAEGEMDRTQLNRIVPALEHLLRNAVDHGLEAPEQRKSAKKRVDGQIDILFSREGSEIVIKIVDDGAGIDLDALRRKAIERDLIKESTQLTDQELMDFILESGFTTAKNITQISGRGVGMDVVNNEIKQLNGSLHIGSERGKGSTFTIRLPLTVLVNQALMFDISGTQYALSLSNIEHIVRVSGTELQSLISGTQHAYQYADKEYKHLNLNLMLHGVKNKTVEEDLMHPLILARSGDQRVALHVDQLIGRQEIVIKSVGPQLSSLANISGATILPNGEVALILDISSLIRSSHTLHQMEMDGVFADVTPEVKERIQPTVMIVDDSITVRKVTERLLKRHNFKIITAKDGVDALTVLLEQIPDIMLLDVEMPRMDGFELASTMRNDDRLKNIPVIMITSRTGDKHRDRALKIGVNMYMGKPYHEQALLENIDTLLKQQKAK